MTEEERSMEIATEIEELKVIVGVIEETATEVMTDLKEITSEIMTAGHKEKAKIIETSVKASNEAEKKLMDIHEVGVETEKEEKHKKIRDTAEPKSQVIRQLFMIGEHMRV